MEFGTVEWFEKLERRVSFPSMFAFYYNKKDNLIQISKIDSKAKSENVRWQAIEPSPMRLHPQATALINVKTIGSSEDYYHELLYLNELWRTEFK